MTSHIDLSKIRLKSGSHTERGYDRVCLLEAVAWWAHEPHSDHPECVSPAIAAFGRVLNDSLPDDLRQSLVPYIPRFMRTVGSAKVERRRAFLFADFAVRVTAPFALRTVGLEAEAAGLSGLPEITDGSAAESAAESATATAAVCSATTATTAAAWATWSAESAAESARSATRSATTAAWSAESATRSEESAAAWSATTAAWSAASAARSAAWSPTTSATRSAAWSDTLLPAALSVLDRAIALGGEKAA